MIYSFGDIVVDEDRWVIYRNDVPLQTEPKVFSVLLYLIKNRDRLVTRDELLDACWPNVHVGDGTLSRCVCRVRQAIQQPRTVSEPIFTRHGKGYRFVAPVLVRESRQDAPEKVADRASDEKSPERTTEPERRLISLLDCVVTLGEDQADKDAEALHAGVRRFLEISSQVLERFGGRLRQRTGEGVVILFGYGRSAERPAEAAVLAGAEMIERARESGLTARVGIASGRAIVDPIGSGEVLAGVIVEIDRMQAASLRTAAGPGQCIVDGNTAHLVEGRLVAEPAGEVNDGRNVIPTFSLSPRCEQVPAVSDDMPFFGRTSELAYLEHCWKYAADGHGLVVHVTGDPGVGKSRLIRELIERVALPPDSLLRFQCSPYHRTAPLFPLRALLRSLPTNERITLPRYRTKETESLPERYGLLGAQSQSLCNWRGSQRSGSLCDDDAGWDRDTTEDLVSHIFRLAEQRPAILWVDDLQWADPATLRVLESIQAGASRARLLVLCSGRAVKAPTRCGSVDFSTIALCPFTQAETFRFLEKQGKEVALTPRLIEGIAARTDGVPLYLREVLRLVLAHPADRSMETVPRSLLSLLQSRLDEVNDVKRVAQLAAILGRSFTKALLAAVTKIPDEELEEAIGRLIANGLLSERRQGPDISYRFNHSLVRDVAYGMMLKEPRRQRHRVIAETLIEKFPEIATEQPDEIANHFRASEVRGRALICGQAGGCFSTGETAHRNDDASQDALSEAMPATPANLAVAGA